MAYSPLGRGFLGGSIKRLEDLAPDDWRRSSPRYQGENFEHNVRLAERVEALAQDKGVAPATLAIAWVMAQGHDMVPIPGTKRRSYLEQNAAAAGLTLTGGDLEQIEAATPKGAAIGDRYHSSMMSFLNR